MLQPSFCPLSLMLSVNLGELEPSEFILICSHICCCLSYAVTYLVCMCSMFCNGVFYKIGLNSAHYNPERKKH